jgi:hypothetical protein
MTNKVFPLSGTTACSYLPEPSSLLFSFHSWLLLSTCRIVLSTYLEAVNGCIVKLGMAGNWFVQNTLMVLYARFGRMDVGRGEENRRHNQRPDDLFVVLIGESAHNRNNLT